MYPEWVEKLSDKLEPISVGIQWVLNKLHPRIEYIKIDRWDTWSMDSTLAPIILPMLKQLRETKHGSAVVDDEDVPLELRYTTTEDWDNQKCFDFYHEYEVKEGDRDIHARWNWVLDEMIWTFERICDDDNWKFNDEMYQKHHNRINNGTRLFGKYYRNLWD